MIQLNEFAVRYIAVTHTFLSLITVLTKLSFQINGTKYLKKVAKQNVINMIITVSDGKIKLNRLGFL